MSGTTITNEETVAIKQYAEVKVAIHRLEERLSDLKPAVQDVLTRIHAEKTPVDAGVGLVSLRPRKVWVYSKEVEELEAQVKKLKKNEEAVGTATFDTRFDVYFKEK